MLRSRLGTAADPTTDEGDETIYRMCLCFVEVRHRCERVRLVSYKKKKGGQEEEEEEEELLLGQI